MKERPILFSGAMVRAILEGRKTQTRRLVKPQPIDDARYCGGAYIERKPGRTDGGQDRTSVDAPVDFLESLCPYGARGDWLWVRETWSTHGCFDHLPASRLRTRSIEYQSDGFGRTGRIRPSIHMPRWASRITLEVTEVRVQRVQSISLGDIEAEGYPGRSEPPDGPYLKWFTELWDGINAKRGFGWNANPWVWVITFKPVEPSA